MLVLTRKLMEKLYIGEDICVTVVRLEGGQVRLGIEAPREIAVWRAELLVGVPGGARTVAGTQPVHLGSEAIRALPRLVHGIDSRRRGRSR